MAVRFVQPFSFCQRWVLRRFRRYVVARREPTLRVLDGAQTSTNLNSPYPARAYSVDARFRFVSPYKSHLLRQHQATCNRRLLFVLDLALCLHKGQYTNKRKRAYGVQVAKRLARMPSRERRVSLRRSSTAHPTFSANGIISDSASYPIFVLGDTLYKNRAFLVKTGFVQRFLYISTWRTFRPHNTVVSISAFSSHLG